ncbi:MAG TPA: vanadium-dependent haloperoxidase [Paracoccaceae bacterium]|nr:vanadium-dependent haloperoxidase [Paracoccaceae bacterium]
MDSARRLMVLGGLAAALGANPLRAAPGADPAQVLDRWYRLVLELVRHTPTYSPPVASRAFACVGITVFEALASGSHGLRSLAGQVTDLPAAPARTDAPHDAGAVLHGALAAAVRQWFGNTGPTGQRAMAAMDRRLGETVTAGLDPAEAARSLAYGQAVAAHVLAWSLADGGAVVENMGFPQSWPAPRGPESWVPTSLVRQQQAPLLPHWGDNRPFAMPSGNACPLPPPPAYSEEPGSAFHAEAMEVYTVTRNLTDEQRLIARFWSDDPMLSPTPPGHWISIALDLLDTDGADAPRRAEVLALLGIAMADAFIGCWHSKFEFDLLRPVTYIRRVIDPAWQPMLITPPFPEYPSGHSTQSGAAEVVLAHLFGPDRAFDDATHVDEGMPVRRYPGFRAAAEEAGISRLYGGIHFRAAIDRGLEQGRCIGAHAIALRTRGA